MKKIILYILIRIAFAGVANAQISNWGAYSQSFPKGAYDVSNKKIAIISAELMVNNAFWSATPNDSLYSLLLSDTAFKNPRPYDFVAINSFDTAKAQFFARNIVKGNASRYQFRVLENLHQIIVPWSAITTFTTLKFNKLSGLPGMAYLGGYSTTPGNMIIVDLREKASGKIITSSVVAWEKIQPVITDIYTANELNLFLTRLTRPWSIRRYRQLPKQLKLLPNDNALIFYLKAETYKKEQIEYQLLCDDQVVNNWRQNDLDNNFIWLKGLKPGRYSISIRYSAQREHVTEYHFEVETPWYQSTGFHVAIFLLVLAFIGFIIFGILLFRQRQKAERELANKTGLQLELKSIHAQLNPHFVFNALNSIQGLVNKRDLAGASNYLSVFGQLMRSSLVNSGREQVTLTEEIKTLETYLKLEQLRFGFEYRILVDSSINIYETEIPSLLLQPLIENGIKHGVSGLQETGNVVLNFKKNGYDMQVLIKDNGQGFSMAGSTNGYGLKLTRDRIKLLNQVMNGQSITMEITSSPGNPTTVALTFKNWFNEN